MLHIKLRVHVVVTELSSVDKNNSFCTLNYAVAINNLHCQKLVTLKLVTKLKQTSQRLILGKTNYYITLRPLTKIPITEIY